MRLVFRYENQGFTLVELSIVIIIIGFLIAGVGAGTSLITQAKLTAALREVTDSELAFNTFTLRYNAIPGDMSNASSYWPSAIDGDGNGKVELGIYDAEVLGSWQHLSLAGMVSGSYTGTGTPTVGINIPKSSYSTTTTYWPWTNSIWNHYDPDALSLVFSGYGWLGWIDYRIKNIDAAAMDLKADDGLPFTGRLIGFNSEWGWPSWSASDYCTNYDIFSGASTQPWVNGPAPSDQAYVVTNSRGCTLVWGLYGYSFKGAGR